MKTSLALGVAALALLLGSVEAVAHTGDTSVPRTDAARGLVYRGLERAHAGSRCGTGFIVRLRGGRTTCTHGPDPAPAGRDVRRSRSVEQLTAPFGGAEGTTAEGAGQSVGCFGDGSDGNRVQ